MEKKFIRYREIIIGFLIAAAMIITGSFLDLNISKAIYETGSINWFSIIMTGIAETPTYLSACVAGTLIIIASQGLKKWQKAISWIFGIIAIAFGSYYVYKRFTYITTFEQTEDAAKVINFVAIIFAVILVSVTILLLVKYMMNKDRHLLRNVGIMIATMVLFELCITNGAKWIMSRPRPDYIFGDYGVLNDFRGWWEWRPFDLFKQEKATGLPRNNWKSCPSGHSCTAVSLAYILPFLTLLNSNWKNNKKARVIAFYIGLGWGIITAISRVYALDHFLSDVGIGLIDGLTCGLIVQLVLPCIIKE